MDKYSFIQKLLHYFILDNNFIKKSLFDLEKIFFKNSQNIIKKRHIFITGLPRSGTTALLEFFYKSEDFASLTYSDMPFIMSPNIGSKIYKKKNSRLVDRIHKDGIKYNLDSPEAFDEVFFKTFDNHRSQSQEFLNFVGHILNKYNKFRYLSKNKNNYKRITLISSIFPNSSFLIPYRSPLQHAYSLLNQHKNFLEIQKNNKFILRYMNFLGHNEFGLNYNSWNKPKNYYDHLSINHWLEQWYLFYENILNKINTNNTYLISYESLCKNNIAVDRIFKKFNFELKNKSKFFNLSYKNFENNYDLSLLNKCEELKKDLDNICFF